MSTAFGALLRRHRLASGLSQEALAERAELSTDAVAALEQGRRTHPRGSTVTLLAGALDLEGEDRVQLLEAAREPGSGDRALLSPLPVEMTSFVGRADELGELERLLLKTRLVTLTGPGGVGKTRLGVELARRTARRRACRAWVAALDSCPRPEFALPVVAAACGVHEGRGVPLLVALRRHLEVIDGVLVLDSCEQVLAAAGELAADLLRSAPGLQLVATSRIFLHVPGETTWRVPSLRVPAAGAGGEDATRAEAVRLFLDRAASAGTRYAPGSTEVAEIGRLCRRLDGIPLAVELAAARVRVLTPGQILSRLDDALFLLDRAPRDAPPRQRTLRATVDWSYRLLDPQARRLFDRLAVFADSFDLEAAEAVNAGPAIEPLSTLIDHSLVLSEGDGQGERRFRLLEALRQFGRAQLDARGELDEVRRRLTEHYLRLAQLADRELRIGDRSYWLPRLRLEHGNFGVALQWCQDHRDGMGLALATALGRYWDWSGSAAEGRAWLESMLALGPDAHPLLATALSKAARLAWLQQDYASAEAWLDRSLALKRAQRDPEGVARRLIALATVALGRGDPARVRKQCERALAIHSRLGNESGIAWAHTFLGYASLEADEPEQARPEFQRALGIHRRLFDARGIVYDLGGLVFLDAMSGQTAMARRELTEGLNLVRDRLEGMPEEQGWVWGCVVLAGAEERWGEVAQLGGAIEAMADAGVHWNPVLSRRYGALVDRAKEELGAPVACELAACGRTMTWHEIVALALRSQVMP